MLTKSRQRATEIVDNHQRNYMVRNKESKHEPFFSTAYT